MATTNELTEDEIAKEKATQSMGDWVSGAISSLSSFNLSNLKNSTSPSSPTEIYDYLLDKELQENKKATFEEYLKLLDHARDQSYTAILIANTLDSNNKNLKTTNNKNNAMGFTNIFNPTTTGTIDNEVYEEFRYALTFPIVEKATFNRQFMYAKEPIPAGENISEFMVRGNLHLVLEGTVSNIQYLKKTIDAKPQITTSALSTIADGVSNMFWNKCGSALKEKCFKLLNSSTATSKALGAYNLASEYNRRFGVSNTITNALGRGNSVKKEQPDFNGYTSCQYFIRNFNNLYGRQGVLMSVYYMGLKYENMALIDMKINSTPKSTQAMYVSLHFEQQNLVRKQATKTGKTPTTKSKNTSANKVVMKRTISSYL